MREIEKQDPEGFQKFLDLTQVPIDGKNVLNVILKILDTTDLQTTTKFIRYSQSNHITSEDESSISHSSGFISY